MEIIKGQYYHIQREPLWEEGDEFLIGLNKNNFIKAFDEAKTVFGGTDLTDVANAERDAIPGSDDLRALIRAQGGG